MCFGMIISNLNIKKKQICYMDKDSFIVYIKLDDIIKILHKMLKQDLILQTMNQIDHYLKEKKVIGLMKDKLGGKIMLN